MKNFSRYVYLLNDKQRDFLRRYAFNNEVSQSQVFRAALNLLIGDEDLQIKLKENL